MDFSSVLMKMLILFAIVIVGYAANKLKIIDRDMNKKLSALVLDITLPSMIIASVLTSTSELGIKEIGMTLLISLVIYAVLAAFAAFIPKLLRVKAESVGAYRFAVMFGNVGFIGYPVCIALYGNEGLFYASMFNILFNVLVFTVGRIFISGKTGKGEMSWKTFFSPCTVASLIALVLAVLKVKCPAAIGEGFETLGDLTTPAALMIIGSSLADIPLRSVLGSPKMYIIALFRLLLFPIALLWGLKMCISSQLVIGVSVVITAMPVATNGTMLCYRYGGDEKTMAQLTFITTVLSIITIPLLAMML